MRSRSRSWRLRPCRREFRPDAESVFAVGGADGHLGFQRSGAAVAREEKGAVESQRVAGGAAQQDHVVQAFGFERALQDLREFAQQRELFDAGFLFGDVLREHKRLLGFSAD